MTAAGIAALFVVCFASAARAQDPCAATANMAAVKGPSQWHRWEKALDSATDYLGAGQGNPARDLLLEVTFTKCGGSTTTAQYKAQGFWYGISASGTSPDGHAFRIRGAFPPGTWQWEITCKRRDSATADTPDCAKIPDPQNPGTFRPDPILNSKGRFTIAKAGGNALYKGGFLKTAPHYLTFDGKGTKFFWLGDTAWNANILMSKTEWEDQYIKDRAKNLDGAADTKFTVIQLGIDPIAAGSTDASNNPPFDTIISPCSGEAPAACYRMNPAFWKGIDDKIDFANQQGIAVVLVGFIQPLTKSLADELAAVLTDPAEAKVFAQHIAARLYGNFVIFSPGFDHAISTNLGVIDAVGSAIGDSLLGVTTRHLVTNHSAGGSNVTDYTQNLQSKLWLDFQLFQSGTPSKKYDPPSVCNLSDEDKNELCNITERAATMATTLWKAKPTKPAINGEAVYPSVTAASDRLANHGRYRARQTAYLSMLSGAAGYSMGTCGVVDWKKVGLAMCPGGVDWQWDSHDPVRTAETMKILRAHFQSITTWERLRPEPTRIRNQSALPETKMALAYDGSSAILAYLPHEAGAIEIDFNKLPTVTAAVPGLANVDTWPTNWTATWLSPRGLHQSPQTAAPERVPATGQRLLGVFRFTKPACDFDPTDECANDWVLRIMKIGKSQSPPSGGVAVTALNGPGIVSAGLRIIAETKDISSGAMLSQTEIGGDGTTSPGPPKMASEPSGNYMVVWQAENDGTTTISGRVLNSQGEPLTAEILIASGTTAAPGHPSVTALGNGDFLVVWAGSDENRSGPWIRAKRFDRWGTALTPSRPAVNCDFVPGDFPQVAAVGTGGYAIAWEMDGGGIYVLQTDSAGNRGEARFAQGSSSTAVLESLEDGDLNAVLSYGLYTDDEYVGGETVDVVTQSSSCPPPPFAVNDAFSTDQNKPLTIGVQELLSNDAPGVTLVQIPSKCPLAADGSYCTYTPPAGFSGTDTFTYSVKDAENNSGSATVTITVVGDEPPHAVFYVSCVNRTCTVSPGSWDDRGITRYLWNWGDGTPVIEPTAPYAWADQTHTYALSGRYVITHTVYDTAGQIGTLQLEPLANTKPTAAADTATTDRDVPVTIPILANDSDPDGDALNIALVTLAQPGASAQVVPSGQSWALRFTPPDSFVGTSTFTYVASDRWGGTASASGTVTVKQWTVIVDALGEQFYTPQNTQFRIGLSTLLQNDYSDNGPLSIVSYDTSILMGTLDCTTDPTACTYRPPMNASGVTLFKYKACDAAGHCDTATVRIYVLFRGYPPVAADDYFTTVRNTAKTFTIQDVVANDYDANGDTLSVALPSGAKDYGTLACTTPMYKCTYTPNAGFVGTDRFPYTAWDGVNTAVNAFINVLTLPPVTPVFDAREDVRVTGTNQQVYISYDSLTANDYSPQGYAISVVSLDTTGLLGTMTCDAAACLFKPGSYFQGTTRFKYTAADGHGGTDTTIVKIRVGGTNADPVAAADSFSMPKNTVLRFSTFELLRNDYDPQNDPLAATVVPKTTAKGTLACDAKQYWCTYTPLTNATGADTFTYFLRNGSGIVTSTFTINIQP